MKVMNYFVLKINHVDKEMLYKEKNIQFGLTLWRCHKKKFFKRQITLILNQGIQNFCQRYKQE